VIVIANSTVCYKQSAVEICYVWASAISVLASNFIQRNLAVRNYQSPLKYLDSIGRCCM